MTAPFFMLPPWALWILRYAIWHTCMRRSWYHRPSTPDQQIFLMEIHRVARILEHEFAWAFMCPKRCVAGLWHSTPPHKELSSVEVEDFLVVGPPTVERIEVMEHD